MVQARSGARLLAEARTADNSSRVSVFLDIPESRWVASNELAFAIRDGFPVSPGHTLVITRRVVPDWFGASDAERAAIVDLVDLVKKQLDDELHPSGPKLQPG